MCRGWWRRLRRRLADRGMRHRYYSTKWGRFLTEDPLGVWGDPIGMGNDYQYAGGNPGVYGDPFGLQVGHHFVPRELWRSGGPNSVGIFSDAVQDIFDTTTGAFSKKGVHRYDEAHKLYNAAVKGEMDRWLRGLGKSPSKVTQAEARKVLEYVRSGPCNKVIRAFNERLLRHVEARAAAVAARLAARYGVRALTTTGAKKGAKKAVAPLFFAYDWYESGSLGHATQQAVWPISEALTGASGYGLHQSEDGVDARRATDMSELVPEVALPVVKDYQPMCVPP